MQAVAAMRLRRYSEMLKNVISYSDGLENFLQELFFGLNMDQVKDLSNLDDFNEKKSGKILVVLAGTSRGFCGGLHRQIVTDTYLYLKSLGVDPTDQSQVNFITINKPAQRIVSKLGGKVLAFFNGPFKDLNPYSLLPISELVYQVWKAGDIKKVILVNGLGKLGKKAEIEFSQILPLALPKFEHSETETKTPVNLELSSEEILAEFLPQWLEAAIHTAILKTQTAEEGARMVAMNQATDNAKRLSERLRLSYFRQRQAKITQEISEIVGGSL
jgi:F-type H+-transporting ATPase subunit gamma